MVEPMSPRLASAMVSTDASAAAARVRSSTAIPADPWRSYRATCGFTAAAREPTASSTVSEKRSSPAASSVSPQRCSSAGCGSMPTHSGPRSAMARPSREPKVSRPAAGAVDASGILERLQVRGVFLQARDGPFVGAQRLDGLDGGVELGHGGDARDADRRRGGTQFVAVAAGLATGGGVEDHVDLAGNDEVRDGAFAFGAGALGDLPDRRSLDAVAAQDVGRAAGGDDLEAEVREPLDAHDDRALVPVG